MIEKSAQNFNAMNLINYIIAGGLISFIGYFIGSSDNPIEATVYLCAYFLILLTFIHPAWRVHLIVLLLFNVALMPVLSAEVNFGSVILPGPFVVAFIFTSVLVLLSFLAQGRMITFAEPSLILFIFLILTFQLISIIVGYGKVDIIIWQRFLPTIQGFVAFFIIAYVFNKTDQVQNFLRILAVSYIAFSFINILISLKTGFGYRYLSSSEYNLTAATTLSALMNIYIPLGICCFIAEQKGYFWRLIFLISVLGALVLNTLTLSRGGILGMFITLSAFLLLGRHYLKRKMFIWGTTLIILSIILFASFYKLEMSDPLSGSSILSFAYKRTTQEITSGDEDSRLNIYINAFKSIVENPLTGVGIGVQASHSLFLGAALEGGIVYLGLWLLLFATLIKRAFRIWEKYSMHIYWGPVTFGLFTSLLNSFFLCLHDNIMYFVGYMVIFWFLRGIEGILLRNDYSTV
ncbi:MAG: O-antigen ligase family protein [Nitrospirota bacterium]